MEMRRKNEGGKKDERIERRGKERKGETVERREGEMGRRG